MRLYWTFGSLPELNHFTPDERREVLRRANATTLSVGMWMRSAVGALLAAAVLGFTLPQAMRSTWVVIAMYSLAVALMTSLAFQVQFFLQRASMRSEIMRLLRGERVPVCLKCGYDQTRNTTDRCSECGASIRVPR